MLNRKFFRALPLIALVAIVAFAGQTGIVRAASTDNPVVLSSPMLADTEPITYYTYDFQDVPTWDPQKATDSVSVQPIQNLFVGLTDIDPKTSVVRPYAATKWEKNAAGDVWTFTIRDDIPWVRWDPQAQQATKVGMVTAHDFEYGIKRSCDPRMGSLYTQTVAAMIKGCDVVAKLEADKITDKDFDQIEVKALSDTQLQITTQGPLGYFFSTTPMWMFRATPKSAIDEFGDKWTDPGKIVTSGPFLLDAVESGVSRQFVKNPLFPEGVVDNYGGNLERVSYIILRDGSTAYSLYQTGQLDLGILPRSQLNAIRADPEKSKLIVQTTQLATYYFGFMYDKPPFDKVEARRAFSAMIDRNNFVQEVQGGRGVPIAHFMPPGIRGAVPINEVGVGDAKNLGFDADYAKAQLAAAGYPDCKDFPSITILSYADTWSQFLQNAAKTVLGCDPAKIVIENVEFGVLLQTIKPSTPTQQRPNIYTLGWNADYPDAQNFMDNVLWCQSENDFKRPCNDLDKKIEQGAKETDPAKRNDLYRAVEEGFFGQDGEFPIAPLFVPRLFALRQPWFTKFFQTDGLDEGLFGGVHWDTYIIDQAAQLAARGGANKPQETPVPTEQAQ